LPARFAVVYLQQDILIALGQWVLHVNTLRLGLAALRFRQAGR